MVKILKLTIIVIFFKLLDQMSHGFLKKDPNCLEKHYVKHKVSGMWYLYNNYPESYDYD